MTITQDARRVAGQQAPAERAGADRGSHRVRAVGGADDGHGDGHAHRTGAGLGIPERGRGEFIAAGVAGFAAFALLGLFSSLVPGFIASQLHQGSHAIQGAVVFLLLAVAAATQVAVSRFRSGPVVLAGLGAFLAGLGLIVAALAQSAMSLFLAGTVADRPYVFTKGGLVWDPADRSAAPRRVGAPASIRREVEGSLRRLRVERIDLYQMHWPAEDGTPLEEYWQAFTDLKREGKIRAAGLSNHGVFQLEMAEQGGTVDAIQPQFSLIHRDAASEVLPWACAHQAGVIAPVPGPTRRSREHGPRRGVRGEWNH